MRFTTVLLALALTTATPADAQWKTITTKAELKSKVVGRSFVEPKSKAWFRLRRNGKLAGGVGKDKLTGVWQWQDKYVCYNRALGGKKLPGDCIVIQTNGKNIATIRAKGKGRKTAYAPK